MTKFVPEYIRSDFKQELFIILLTKPHELILELHDRKELVRYIARIIINLMRQANNVIHKKILIKSLPLHENQSDKIEFFESMENGYIPSGNVSNWMPVCEDPTELQIRKYQEDKEDEALSRIEGLDEELGTCYYRLLTVAYKKHGSMREVSRQTGIPVMSISDSFKKLRKHLSK